MRLNDSPCDFFLQAIMSYDVPEWSAVSHLNGARCDLFDQQIRQYGMGSGDHRCISMALNIIP